MATLIHATHGRARTVFRVYGPWGERRFPSVRSIAELYGLLAEELSLPATASRKEVVFTLMDRSWDGSKWIDDFRTKMKKTRQDRGLTQGQLAERSGLSLDGIRSLEQGIRRPSAQTARRVAVALEVSVDELLGVIEVDPSSETHRALFS